MALRLAALARSAVAMNPDRRAFFRVLPFKKHSSPKQRNPGNMWRSLFLALGLMAIIVGVESMLIENAVVYSSSETRAVDIVAPGAMNAKPTKVWQPGEIFPWALLSLGALTVIYAFTLPRRFNRRHAE